MAAPARRVVWSIAAGFLLASGPALPEGADWLSPLHREHPLAGTIWSAEASRPVSRDELADALARSRVVLLGEVHDNADHHLLRAWAIAMVARRRQAADGGRTGPALVFEHIRADQQPVVDDVLSSDRRGADGASRLLQQLEWDRSGWPPGEIFAPLFEAALQLRLPVLGGNAPGETVLKVGRQGLSALPGEERARLGLDVQLEAPLQAALIAEIEASHCGLLPGSAFAPMALAQRYRDAHLADVLLSAMERHGSAVLIAGNGHVRADRGVPWHLRRRAPGSASVVVAFMEVEHGMGDPGRYVPRDAAGRPAADYVWLTPQAERPDDPCEDMRRRFNDAPGAKPPDGR
ncbi:MAG: ChaN family lipoprotein [Rhodobacteraceae bacterium]|nr:ChaN family lipoprotein [Paracoccaceae bacterium]